MKYGDIVRQRADYIDSIGNTIQPDYSKVPVGRIVGCSGCSVSDTDRLGGCIRCRTGIEACTGVFVRWSGNEYFDYEFSEDLEPISVLEQLVDDRISEL